MENTANTETTNQSIENTINYYPSVYFVCAGLGTLAIGSALKMLGQNQIGSTIRKFTIPLMAIGLYKIVSNNSSTNSSTKNTEETIEKENENKPE
ncbi:hypothetical protein IRZ71_11520 [Flavobacterium sp. ANB]|uniref:hypothetical protein n=1 Tax=unclassified Flavobacterium TaxID=196869 RepID=UPI0012BA055B|nr:MULTISPECIES: hypothetical protein [unclassified Flavobacterium]MBF4516980.1 hypothetical protein [Flavobacterium sp. ANB]MTD69124.1 hypothetical protein [Flavobacterium sp. LC2016-13]